MVGIFRVFGSALLILLGWSPGQARAGELTVEVAAGTLSVHAVDAPLADVLAAIGQRARARILIESVLQDQVGKERITASFAGLAMDEGLRRLLKNQNFILGFGATGVDEIRVYIDGRTGFRDLTAREREPAKLSATPSRRNREAAAPPPEDRAKLAELRHVTLTSRDPTARLEALQELGETEDTGYLLESVIEALGRERDAKVLEGLIDIVRDRGPIPAGPLRTLVTSDRDGAARAQALELLAEHAGGDQSTRTLLQTLSRNDPSEHVRDTARTLLDDLQAPRPPRTR
jgi:hypothetical protein